MEFLCDGRSFFQKNPVMHRVLFRPADVGHTPIASPGTRCEDLPAWACAARGATTLPYVCRVAFLFVTYRSMTAPLSNPYAVRAILDWAGCALRQGP
jgi:hypothetical protein